MTTPSVATGPTPGRKVKPKSPAAPSRNLQDAVADVMKLYLVYSHAGFSKEEIASKLGVKVTSGPFGARVFTLKEYGLIEKYNGNFKVSQSFMTFKTAPKDGAVFKRAALDAIKQSKVFSELLAEFKGKLPDQDSVAQRLETQKHFNADRSKEIADGR
jgi:hypothetical protein